MGHALFRVCAMATDMTNRQKECEVCGKLFSRPSYSKSVWDRVRCCSRECGSKIQERWNQNPDRREDTYKRLYGTLEERFDELYVPEPNCGCWLWVGRDDNRGYGTLPYLGKRLRAHRISYERFVGEIPTGLFVMHKCDVRCCVNPHHLTVGTNRDNIMDAVEKGRIPSGEAQYAAQLNESAVREIRHSTKTNSALAKKFGVNPSTIRNVRIGKSWKNIQ